MIPARGGSKRIPRKNLRQVAGKPLIAWTIEAAERASRLTTFVVSTEDANIAQVANLYGAYVVKRPEGLAADDSPTGSVLHDSLDWMDSEGAFDLVCCLHPTSPIRKPGHIDEAIELLWNSHYDTLASVSCRKRNYQHNASIYVMRTSWLRANPGKHYDDNTMPYLMDGRHSIDIDNEDDLKVAELFLNGRKHGL